MDRRNFVAGIATLPLAVGAVATTPKKPALTTSETGVSNPSLKPVPATGRPLQDRYRLSVNRVLHGSGPSYTPEFLLEDIRATPGRRFTNFSGDVSGRWIGALAASSSTFGDSFPVLDEVVHRAIALQHGDGYFGKTFHYDHPDDNDLALLWGNGRLLVGLMEYYAYKPDPTVLASARKLGDFLLRIAPKFNSQKMADEFGAAHFASSYICWTQQTEGLAALYAATQDVRYRDLCADISKRTERRAADHVHGYLCSVRGTVDLYMATGDKNHLDRAVAAWSDVMHSGDVLITGGVPEAWTPKKKRTEGCAECDWLRLNLSLYRATSDPTYLEAAEYIYFNEFSMNQFATGDFGHARLNDTGTPEIVYVRAWWCCTLHGLRTFADVQKSVFRTAGRDIFYELPLDGHFKGGDTAIIARSNLAVDGTVQLHITHPGSTQTLTFRKPSWAESVAVTRNGKKLQSLRVENIKAGDLLVAEYAMTMHPEKTGTSRALAKREAIHFGPWLLGAPSIANPGYFNELHPLNIVELGSLQSSVEHASTTFDVPFVASSLSYVPAEFPEQPARVQLRAVAEQTAHPPTEWETAFLVKEKAQ
jgi:DUF1680 family protein